MTEVPIPLTPPRLDGKIIEPSIGPSCHTLLVYEATLKATSAFLAAAFNHDFCEAKAK